MGSYTGYIRARIARALKNVELTEYQKNKLAEIFLKQLENAELFKEYKSI